MNSNERDERLKQIRQRLAKNELETYAPDEWWADMHFLLSLLDSQADDDARLDAMLKKAGIQHTCHRPHDAGTTLERLARNVSDTAATRMRDKCVAILKRWCKCGPRIRCSFCNVRKEVESLTLDQVEQKQ